MKKLLENGKLEKALSQSAAKNIKEDKRWQTMSLDLIYLD
jgi:hypothetical protein